MKRVQQDKLWGVSVGGQHDKDDGKGLLVVLLLAEPRRGWSLMIFCARATRSGSSVWFF